MNPAYIGCIIAVIMLWLIIYEENRKSRIAATRMIRRNKNKQGRVNDSMKELAKSFIGKECIIYTLSAQINGTVKEVGDGAVLLENKGNLEAVNLDYITRIREYPKNKKGKKKSIVLD